MSRIRNSFLAPRFTDPEFLITRLRRDDLITLAGRLHEQYGAGNADILDFGARKAPYQQLFDTVTRSFKCADMPADHESRTIDVLILENGKLDLPDESVDVVLSLQVLEHVTDVDLYLSEAKRVLRPGGKLWLTTHGMWPYHPIPTDFHRWTLDGLKRAISNYFTVEDSHAMMGAPAYAFMIYIRILWNVSRTINAAQSSILNRLTGTRWGKSAPREKRITNRYLYLGNLAFMILGGIFNLMITWVDSMTSIESKCTEAAVFRVAATKTPTGS